MAGNSKDSKILEYKDMINQLNKTISTQTDMLPSYRTMKYKSPIWGYFHVQKE